MTLYPIPNTVTVTEVLCTKFHNVNSHVVDDSEEPVRDVAGVKVGPDADHLPLDPVAAVAADRRLQVYKSFGGTFLFGIDFGIDYWEFFCRIDYEKLLCRVDYKLSLLRFILV